MLTYDEALSTLLAMFGPKWTKDNLDLVLRHFDGHMENTVDTILAHSDTRPQDLIEQLTKAQAGIDLDEQLARELGREEEDRMNSSTVGANVTVPPALRRGPAPEYTSASPPSRPRTQLPPDFLRIPGYAHSDASSTLADDEALARALQNELFMKQIRDDPELSHLSRPRYSTTTGLAGRQGNPFALSHRQGPGAHDGPGFMEALSGTQVHILLHYSPFDPFFSLKFIVLHILQTQNLEIMRKRSSLF